jgi:hypothetical protein
VERAAGMHTAHIGAVQIAHIFIPPGAAAVEIFT